MSKIDEMITKHCPDGIEYIPLADLVDYQQPGKFLVKSTAYDDSFATPVLTAGQTFVLGYTNETEGIYRSNPDSPVVIFDDFTTAFKWVDFPFKAKSSAMKILKPKPGIDLRYVWYAMQCLRYSPQDHARQWIATYSQFKVPFPPLEIQREIVRILDTFSKMEAELEAELEARKQQYEHYRQELLSANSDEDSMSLGEIFEMRAGTHVKAAEIADDPTETHPYRCFGGNGVRGYVSGYNYDEDVAFIGRQGALCGNVHRAQGKIYATEHAVVVTPKAEVDMAWAFHKLTEMDLNQYKTKSAQPGLAVGRIKEIVISFPNIQEQRRIVGLLDKFDALVNDLSNGLPAEIAARRQQYEYYRDKLLTFKELEPAS